MPRRSLQPSTRTIVGVAVVLFAAVLLASGLHHAIRVGTCSSTGYSSYGPVPICPHGVGAWIGFAGGGIVLIMVGAVIARAAAALIGCATFIAIGVGSLTVYFDKTSPSGTRTFALLFGGWFVVLGVLGLLLAVWRWGRTSQSGVELSSSSSSRVGI